MLAVYIYVIAAASSPIPRAQAAMVDRDAKLSQIVLRLEVESRQFAAGESEAPDGPPALAAIRSERLAVHLDGRAAERRVHVATPQGAVIDYTENLEGCEGTRAQANKAGVQRVEPLSAAEVRAFQRTLAGLPLWLLSQASAAKPGPKLKQDGRALPTAIVKSLDGPLTVAFDPATGLPLFVRRQITHPLLGLRMYEVRYTAWRSAGALRIPKSWTVTLGTDAIEYATVTDAQTTRATSTAPVCKSAPAAEESDVVRLLLDRNAAPDSREWQLVPVANGVHRMSGAPGDVLVVEMRDHIVVFDAPCAGRCAQALVQELATAFPKKPLRTLVLSHHHESRAIGVLAFAPHIKQLVVAGSARAWAERLLDRVAKRDRPTVLDVAPARTLTDGARQIRLSRLIDHPHATTLLMAHVLDAKVLWSVDVDVPREHPLHHDWNARLASAEKSLGVGTGALVVDGHGSVAPHTPLASAR